MQYPEALVTDMGLGTQPKLKAITVLFSIFLLKPTGKEDFITILSILDLSNLLLKKKKKSSDLLFVRAIYFLCVFSITFLRV